MRTVVCIPYREGGEHRDRAFDYVKAWWENLGFEVLVGQGPKGPFNRSAARNQAARRAGRWDVAVFADADTVGDSTLIDVAVFYASQGMLAYPFTQYEALSASGTKRLMETGWASNPIKRKQNSPGGILAVSRGLFDEVRGWDEEFQGWGYEDLAFSYAAGTFGGIHRESGKIQHLWHPIATDKRNAIAGKTHNRARMMRYREANGDPKAMRALLDELG